MAYEFATASSRYIETVAPAASKPLTVAGFVNIPTANVGVMCAVGRKSPAHRIQIQFASNVNENLDIATSSQYASISNLNFNSTMHVASAFGSSTSRVSYINGANKTINTSNSGTAETYTYLSIGSRYNETVGAFFLGLVSELGVWNVALTDAEIASLAKGFSPRRIRPQSLVFYAPLLRNLQDLRQGLALTAVNSPTVANHPRVY